MSIDLKLDIDTHDLAFKNNGDLILIDGQERIAQEIKVLLLTFLGEWFLNTDFGIPYLESVLVKNPSRTQIEAIFRSKVKEVPGVLRVPTVEISIEAGTRKSRISLPDIETDQGLITVSVVK
jgi:hypothetical protein